jgi:integrase
MRHHRYQRGSLQIRKRGGRRVWVVLYYRTDGGRGYHELGAASGMAKGAARKACDEWMAANVNGGDRDTGIRPPLVGEFLQEVFLPFYRRKWKASSRLTAEKRLRYHVIGDLGKMRLDSLGLAELQAWLQIKADAGLSHSTVNMLRFDLRAIFSLAKAEGVIAVDPTGPLYTPKVQKLKESATLSQEEVFRAIDALPRREALMLHLTCLAGMRPGEMLALQRKHISGNYRSLRVEQRVYEGLIDDPKTRQSFREVELAPETAAILAQWMRDAVEGAPEAYLFASASGTPVRPGNVMRRIIRPNLRKVGLESFNFQVARRTHASLGHDIDAKVMADQRGHGIGVALDTYTKATQEAKSAAARKLAGKVLAMPKQEKSA